MKQLFTLVFLLLSLTFSFAQNLVFNASPVNDIVLLDGTNEIQIDVTVSNLSTDTISITWERTQTKLPSGWSNYICDPLHCFGPSTATQHFTLAGSASGIFSIHMTPNELIDYAVIDIKFFETGDPSKSISGSYTFGEIVGTNDFDIASIALYPNPAKSYVKVENGGKVESVEIFNLLGVKVLQSTNLDYIDVATLKSGLYLVRMTDKSGKVLTTQRLQKN